MVKANARICATSAVSSTEFIFSRAKKLPPESVGRPEPSIRTSRLHDQFTEDAHEPQGRAMATCNMNQCAHHGQK